MKKILFIILNSLSILTITACQGTSFDSSEQSDISKYHNIITLVDTAKEEQLATKDQLKTVLEKFSQVESTEVAKLEEKDVLKNFSKVVPFEGGNIEKKYVELKLELTTYETHAVSIKNKIQAIDLVTKDLIDEWKKELIQYRSDEFRNLSQQDLNTTEQSFSKLINSMKKSESQMYLVLDSFRDHVLLLKHKLYASTVDALKIEKNKIEAEINTLIKDMETSIKDANDFINSIADKSPETEPES